MLANVDDKDNDSWSSGMETSIGRDEACMHNSVELLHRQGIDFKRIQDFEVDLIRFAKLMMSSSRLVCNDAINWVNRPRWKINLVRDRNRSEEGGGEGKRQMENGKDEHDGWWRMWALRLLVI
ncbi:CCR4-associated factor 1-like protein 11 [Pyrus ussuriensis x Pyrus communis]|uniref:CCR4-associated factor 1-like protein 11 n=1 Tax=Pyrus ussuriensis x Pyrus communis TaxID=2448454 RepID=A0A5N5HJR9_9ROSA|nr:CCR4-associated factor 1-like protein 11 [Pyrus ussuriensis x Pyrus communis]